MKVEVGEVVDFDDEFEFFVEVVWVFNGYGFVFLKSEVYVVFVSFFLMV